MEGRAWCSTGVPDAPENSGVPGDAAELRAENARLRESAGWLRMLAEDKDAKTADLEERIARLERLVPRADRVEVDAGAAAGDDVAEVLLVPKRQGGEVEQGEVHFRVGRLAGGLGWRSAVFSEPDPAVPANVRFLSGYRRVRRPPAKHYPTLRRQ